MLNNPSYVVAAFQIIMPQIGADILNLLGSPPPIDSLLTPLLNEIATMRREFAPVLDMDTMEDLLSKNGKLNHCEGLPDSGVEYTSSGIVG